MTLNLESIEEKMKKLFEAIGVLEQEKKINLKTFKEELVHQGAVCYYLVVGIEAIADIGNHILARYFQKPEKEYEQIIKMLGERGVISKNITKRNEGMAKFRNLLIHLYAKVDHKLVYNYLQKAPDEFREYAKGFYLFLEKTKKEIK